MPHHNGVLLRVFCGDGIVALVQVVLRFFSMPRRGSLHDRIGSRAVIVAAAGLLFSQLLVGVRHGWGSGRSPVCGSALVEGGG